MNNTKHKSDFKIIRYRSWGCPSCDKTVIAAEVEFTSPQIETDLGIIGDGKRRNALRIMSEADMIMHQEHYINYLEDKLNEKTQA